MFSLTEQLRKFQKITYSNKQLDAIITIDDRFHGGGVTIHDLVKQNHLMITQLRKMKDVFINYCKLNDKIYKKIIEHELNVNGNEKKLKQLTTSMSNKIQQTLKTISDLHSNTVAENQKTQKIFIESYIPLKQELRNKVDKESLTPLVQQIIQEYDTGSASENKQIHEEQNEQGGQKEANVQTKQGTKADVQKKDVSQENQRQEQPKSSPSKKNRKSASSEELLLFKTQLTQTLAALQQKINERKAEIEVQAVKLHGTEAGLAKLKPQMEYVKDDIRNLQTKHDQQTRYISSVSDNLMREITSKTNDSVWQSRLSNFNDTYVQRPLNKLRTEVEKNDQRVWNKFEELPPQFQQLHQKIHKVAIQIPPIRESIPPLQLAIDKNENKIKEVEQSMMKGDQVLNKKLSETKDKLDQNVEILASQIKKNSHQLNQKLKRSAQQIQVKVIKGVKHNFGAELKQIALNNRNFSIKLEKTITRVVANEDQIFHVKDILSKKANFTDLVIESQKKASKTDVRELKQKIKSDINGTLKTQMKIPSRESMEKPRRKSMLSGRNLMTPPHSKILDEQQSTAKLFMCGFDELQLREVRQDKKLMLGSALNRKKTKSLRPTTANTVGIFDRIS